MTTELRNDQWTKIVAFLRHNRKVYVGDESECRRFVEAVLWMARSGAQWQLLPEKYGKWNSVYKRCARWEEAGVWEQMFEHFADEPDMESVLLDSTIIRAHSCAAGAPAKRGAKPRKHWGAVVAVSVRRFM